MIYLSSKKYCKGPDVGNLPEGSKEKLQSILNNLTTTCGDANKRFAKTVYDLAQEHLCTQGNKRIASLAGLATMKFRGIILDDKIVANFCRAVNFSLRVDGDKLTADDQQLIESLKKYGMRIKDSTINKKPSRILGLYLDKLFSNTPSSSSIGCFKKPKPLLSNYSSRFSKDEVHASSPKDEAHAASAASASEGVITKILHNKI